MTQKVSFYQRDERMGWLATHEAASGLINRASLLKTRLQVMSKELNDHPVYRITALFISFCWFHFVKFISFLIDFIASRVLRNKTEDIYEISLKDFSLPVKPTQEANETEDSSEKSITDYSLHAEPTLESNEIEERLFSGFGSKEEEEEEEEQETSSFSFKFEYQMPEVTPISNSEENHQAKSTNISNYRFSSETNLSCFVEKPETVTFQVHDSFTGGNEQVLKSEFPSASNSDKSRVQSRDERFEQKFSTASEIFSGFESNFERDTEKHGVRLEEEVPTALETSSVGEVEDTESQSITDSVSAEDIERSYSEFRSAMFSEVQNLEGEKPVSFTTHTVGEREVTESFSGFDSDSDSMSMSDGYSVKDLQVDSQSDGFLSEGELGYNSSTFEMDLVEHTNNIEEGQCSNYSENSESPEAHNRYDSENISDDSVKVTIEEIYKEYSPYIEKIILLQEALATDENSVELEEELEALNAEQINETKLPASSKAQVELMGSSDEELHRFVYGSNVDFDSESNSTDADPLKPNRVTEEDAKTSDQETQPQDEDLNDEELDELESLWEHQDLIEQLKMELKRVRAVGLPTIFEESESPKTVEDLKPWKFEEEVLGEDPMDELHKLYRIYSERMRKLDNLNYQKMHAIGFLQLKNPLESLGAQKPLLPTILSCLSQNLRRGGKCSSDPTVRFLRELQVDSETVYVGQMCLSWEFLRWQYEKARDLPESDPRRTHQYNHVASEFQQFQILLQRFIENEAFQGPRLPSYVKNRCVQRNLLQVPIMKEDCLEDKMEEKRKGNYDYTINCEMLEDIMKECITVFWEFVKRDKDETSTILKGLMRNQAELQDPSDLKLMSEIHASLQKKAKRLNDILKTGNCLVKKFKKPREDRSNQDLFFSQVDMKLVSRVLKMPRIATDQLVWCQKKLSKITFAERKIRREPSFLLFPC